MTWPEVDVPRAVEDLRAANSPLAANVADKVAATVKAVVQPSGRDFAGDTADAAAEVIATLRKRTDELHENAGDLRDRTAEFTAAIKAYNESFTALMTMWRSAVDAAGAVSPYDTEAAARAKQQINTIDRMVKDRRNEFVAYLTRFVRKVAGSPAVTPEIIIDMTNMPRGVDPKLVRTVIEMGYQSSLETLESGSIPSGQKIVVNWGDTGRKDVPAQVATGPNGERTLTIRSDFTGNVDGLLLHESAHLVQGYKGDTPTWVTEGVADYIREYGDGRYVEPGAAGPRTYTREQLAGLPEKWRSQYVPTAQFLNWAQQKNPEVIPRLHQAAQSGKYNDDLLPTLVGATSLDAMWADFVAEQPSAQPTPTPTTPNGPQHGLAPLPGPG